MKLQETYSTKTRLINPFTQANKVEKQAVEDLKPFLKEQSISGRFVFTDKGRLSLFLQKSVGDVLLNTKDEQILGVEIKAEMENKTGNLFLESWSNKSRWTLGWMFTLDTDALMYYFVKSKDLYTMSFQRLKKWAFGTRGTSAQVFQYPEKEQKKYKQLNDTWGWCVPIDILENQVGAIYYSLNKNPIESEVPF